MLFMYFTATVKDLWTWNYLFVGKSASTSKIFSLTSMLSADETTLVQFPEASRY